MRPSKAILGLGAIAGLMLSIFDSRHPWWAMALAWLSFGVVCVFLFIALNALDRWWEKRRQLR